MPEMGGGELAERLTARRPDLKVLYISGYTNDEVLRRGVHGAGARFLQKPFTVGRPDAASARGAGGSSARDYLTRARSSGGRRGRPRRSGAARSPPWSSGARCPATPWIGRAEAAAGPAGSACPVNPDTPPERPDASHPRRVSSVPNASPMNSGLMPFDHVHRPAELLGRLVESDPEVDLGPLLRRPGRRRGRRRRAR